MAVPAWAAVAARPVALAGFGIDGRIEIGASTVVAGSSPGSAVTGVIGALPPIGVAFGLLTVSLLGQGAAAPGTGHRAAHCPVGIAWTACTGGLVFALAHGKRRTGATLGNPVLQAERWVVVGGILAAAVLCGLVLDAALGW